ncbi:MAG TPA: hypothetical protein VKY42_03600 [Trueperaceae bacterium]|nr:hypothetical protein [Trueperaceae bacterium]
MAQRGPDEERRAGGAEEPEQAPVPDAAAASAGEPEVDREREVPAGSDHRSEGPSPTGPVVGERSPGDAELPDEAQPRGAIMVTTVTAVTILVLFFGVLAILMGRA